VCFATASTPGSPGKAPPPEYNFAGFEVWGVNAYQGASFYDLFASYPSQKPLLMTEFGMDAYYARALSKALPRLVNP